MEAVATAERAERTLHEMLVAENGDPYALAGARLYGVTLTPNGTNLTFIAEHGDVYDLLAHTPKKKVKGYDFVGVLTTGWAAPLNADGEADGAPSAHPSRRRVRLFVLASRDAVANVLRFQDDEEHPLSDAGQATGSLAVAIQEFVSV